MTAYFFLLLIGISGLYLGYKKPTIGILLYLIGSPFTNFLKNLLDQVVFFGLWHNVFVLALFFGYVARSLDDQKSFTWDNISVAIVTFILWGVYLVIITFVSTGSIVSSVGGFREYFFIALFILVLYQVSIRTIELKDKIFNAMFGVFIFASFLNLFEFYYLNILLNPPQSLIYVTNYYTDAESSSQYLQSIYREEGSNPLTGFLRTFGIFLQPQLTATFIASTPFFFLSQTAHSLFRRNIKILLILLTSISIFLSLGRTGIAGFVLLFMIIIFFANWNIKVFITLSLTVILFSIYFFSESLFGGLMSSLTFQSEEGYQIGFLHDLYEYFTFNNIFTILFGNGFFPATIELKENVSLQNVLIASETFGLRYLHQIGLVGCSFFAGLTMAAIKKNNITYILKQHTKEIGFLAIIFNVLISMTHYGVFYFTGMDTFFYSSVIILIAQPVGKNIDSKLNIKK